MSTIYRTVFADGRPNLLHEGQAIFSRWLVDKGVEIAELPRSGAIEAEGGLGIVDVIVAADSEVDAIRLRFDEEREGERWSTILTLMTGPEEGWVWIDLERVSDDAYGQPPRIAPPRLVRAFLASSPCRVGSTVLAPEHRVIDEDGVGDLLAELLDPERGVPVLVASRDAADEAAAGARAGALATALAGVANVWALRGTRATSVLAKELGPDLPVYGGAVRTYLPRLAVPDAYPGRHRFARRELFLPRPDRGSQIVARALVARAATGRPPVLFRNRVAMLPGFSRTGADGDELLAELVKAEEERDALQEQLDWALLESEASAAEAEQAQARVRWLEQRLAAVGEHLAGIPTPDTGMPTSASGCVEALELADTHLPLVVIGDTLNHADELDQNPKAGTWGRKAWQTLRALQGYAEAKASGAATGSFLTYCQTASGSDVVPADWVVPVEGETTTNNPRFRTARTFPVPPEVVPDGWAYMEHHVRLEKGSDPAPRLHLWDDTAGATGKIYVGYLGRHLPSFQTN